jgi:hypothetical protein
MFEKYVSNPLIVKDQRYAGYNYRRAHKELFGQHTEWQIRVWL